jgi:hypothetical protein
MTNSESSSLSETVEVGDGGTEQNGTVCVERGERRFSTAVHRHVKKKLRQV